MVKTVLVDSDIEAGHTLIKELLNSKFPLAGALWFYFSEETVWRLILISKMISSDGPKATYLKIQQAVEKAELRLENITLLSPDDSLVQTLRIALRIPLNPNSKTGVRFSRNVINNIAIEDAYIYGLP